MARFRKIDIRMWGDEKFCRLSPLQPSGQALWIYLLTGRHTGMIPGVIVAGKAALAEALKWPTEGFGKALDEVFREEMISADFSAPLIWIPNAVLFNPPANPNVVIGWESSWDEVPECSLKSLIHKELMSYVKELGEGFGKAFSDRCRLHSRNPLVNQEQEQEQENEQENTSCPAVAERPKATKPQVKNQKDDPDYQIYLAYPRRTKPRAALKAIKVARALVYRRGEAHPGQWLLEKAKAYAAARKLLTDADPTQDQYTPHPASWFNAGSYDEDPAEWAKTYGNKGGLLQPAATDWNHRPSKEGIVLNPVGM